MVGTLALIRSSPTAILSSITTSLALPLMAADFISPAKKFPQKLRLLKGDIKSSYMR
jgi:hypothetical protein